MSLLQEAKMSSLGDKFKAQAEEASKPVKIKKAKKVLGSAKKVSKKK